MQKITIIIIEIQNQLRRITTYVYENLKSNMAALTPDIYCYKAKTINQGIDK